jgi:hypothetical protein
MALCVLGLLASSCGVGVRQPASGITETSATLNGKAVSTAGEGSGSYFFLWGVAGATAASSGVKPVQFGADGTQPVSYAADRLLPGVVYGYEVCVADSENPGFGGGCSPLQTFRTAGPVVRAFHSLGNRDCAGPNDFSQEALIVNYEPHTTYGFRADFLEGASGFANAPVRTNEFGNGGIGSIGLTQPFRARVRIWVNPDGDVVQDPGEEIVLDAIYGADEPCTDAQPETANS